MLNNLSSVSSGTRFKAVLWDCDGILFDTEPVHFKTLQETLGAIGITITGEEYYEKLIVFGDEDAIREVFSLRHKYLSKKLLRELMERKTIMTEKVLPKAEMYPGVKETLLQLQGGKIPSIIVSGSFEGEIRVMTKAHGIDSFFVGVVDVTMTARHKPEPDPYIAGLAIIRARGYEVEPAECLVIEDSKGGVCSGKSAGMSVLGVTNSTTREELIKAGADFVVNSLTEIAALL